MANTPSADNPAAASAAAQAAVLAQRIEAAFSTVAQTSMRDMPMNNPRLQVAAVGFRAWQSSWIGALITPWSIDLLQLPMPNAPFPPARADDIIEVALPGAVIPFMPAHMEPLGAYRLCSLFSPAQQFADQATAIATAQETLRLLFEPDKSGKTAGKSGTMPSSPPPSPSPSSPDVPNPSRRRLFGLRS